MISAGQNPPRVVAPIEEEEVYMISVMSTRIMNCDKVHIYEYQLWFDRRRQVRWSSWVTVGSFLFTPAKK